MSSHFKVQDVLACFKVKIRAPDNDAKSQTMMQGFDLKVIKESACTIKAPQKKKQREKHVLGDDF